MQLMMYLGNDLIEAVSVDVTRISIPGYLGNFKRQLKQKYQSLLQETAEQPEFLVVSLAPATTMSVTSTPAMVSTSTAGTYYQ